MAGFLSRIFEKVKSWIHWSWTYLWAVWFILVVFVVYILRGPLKLTENLSYGMYEDSSNALPLFSILKFTENSTTLSNQLEVD